MQPISGGSLEEKEGERRLPGLQRHGERIVYNVISDYQGSERFT